jgi:MFS family permease
MEQYRSSKSFYGYYVVAVCFVNLFMQWGMFVNSFGIFLNPVTESMGWTRESVSLGLSIRSLGMALMAPFAGRLIDRFGAKPVMASGAFVLGLGLVVASRVTQLWQLYVVFFIAGAGLICSTMIPTSLIISNWFVSRRGTAMSAAFVGTGVGGAVMSPVANWIIIKYSWQTAFMLCGGVVALAVVPLILLIIHNRPSDIGLKPYSDAADPVETAGEEWGVSAKEAFSTSAFWLIAAIMFIVALIANGIHNHCPAFLTDIGHSPERAAYVWSTVMGVMIIGKLAFGPIADKWGAKRAMAGVFVIFTISILVLMLSKPYILGLVFACLYGFACGGPLTLYALLTVSILGIKNFGSIYGNLVIAGAVGSAIGPYVAGMAFTRMGTYLPIFSVFIVLAIIGIVCSLSIKPARKEEYADSGSVGDNL